jgi:hypothetical protein
MRLNIYLKGVQSILDLISFTAIFARREILNISRAFSVSVCQI